MNRDRSLPVPAGWHMVALSSEVPCGRVVATNDFPKAIVVLRSNTAALRATARHCPHLGANLATGTIVGEDLVCPLHSWKFDPHGACIEAPGYGAVKRRLRVFAAVERYGAVFVCSEASPGYEPLFQTAAEDQLYFHGGGSLDVDCAWHVIACNGYDIHHFRNIHRRGFHEPPQCERISPRQLRITIHAKVIGDSPRDRLVRRLSHDSIRIVIVNHGGTLLTVETDLGFVKTHLVLSLFPLTPTRTRVRYVLGIPRSSSSLLDRARHAFAFRHAQRFLSDDVVSLTGTQVNPKMLTPSDEHLRIFFDWLGSLPLEDGARRDDDEEHEQGSAAAVTMDARAG